MPTASRAAIVEADFLHRLYSTFANGWPGRGLLLLRLAVFVFLSERCLIAMLVPGQDLWLPVVAAAAGLLLCAGLWTPVFGVITAGLEIWIASRNGDALAAHILAATIALALAVLGPGAWSLDARLFGRRRISISDR